MVFRDIDTILLSRKIIEGGYLNHWSQFARDYRDNPDFAFAQRIVDARKVVFSKTLQTTNWAGTELARRPLAEEINALKTESDRDIIAFGGAGFASTLIANDLVDEYQSYLNPLALGEGLSIFKERGVDSKLELREAEATPAGSPSPVTAHAPLTNLDRRISCSWETRKCEIRAPKALNGEIQPIGETAPFLPLPCSSGRPERFGIAPYLAAASDYRLQKRPGAKGS